MTTLQQQSLQPLPDQIQKYKDVLKDNGINDEVAQVLISDSALSGEGMISHTQCVTVKFANSELADMHLFAKILPPNESQSKVAEDIKAFEKEARFLTEYLPAARQLCLSKGLEQFLNIYPQCYFGDDKMILLENLTMDKKLVMLDKMELHNLETALVAVKSLAIHHALSYAMIKEAGGPTNFFNRFTNLNFEASSTPAFEEMLKPSLQSSVDTNVGILQKNVIKGGPEAATALLSLREKLFDEVLNAQKINPEKDKLLVLCHGDLWNNNMMFSRDAGTNQINDVVMIDFQITCYNSPGLDLCYYFYMSVNSSVRQANLERLLKTYLETFTNAAIKLGHPISITFKEFFADYIKKFRSGFWWGFIHNVGPGMAVLKDFDMKAVDTSDWQRVYDELVQKWLDEHPEEGKNFANQIVNLLEEYQQLSWMDSS